MYIDVYAGFVKCVKCAWCVWELSSFFFSRSFCCFSIFLSFFFRFNSDSVVFSCFYFFIFVFDAIFSHFSAVGCFSLDSIFHDAFVERIEIFVVFVCGVPRTLINIMQSLVFILSPNKFFFSFYIVIHNKSQTPPLQYCIAADTIHTYNI